MYVRSCNENYGIREMNLWIYSSEDKQIVKWSTGCRKYIMTERKATNLCIFTTGKVFKFQSCFNRSFN